MKWTEEEDAYLRRHYGRSSMARIAKTLGRTEQACRSRMRRLKSSGNDTPLERQWFLDRAGKKGGQLILPEIKGAMQPHDGGGTDFTGSKKGGNAYRHTRSGYRPDLDLVVRSGWEANICRILKSHNITFEFEPYIFSFPIKRGNKSYRPDFYLPDTQEWIEVKGYFDKNSKTKMKRFKKYYPEHWKKLTMIVSDRSSVEFCQDLDVPHVMMYRDIRKLYVNNIENWEGK